MSTIDPFEVLKKIADATEDSEDREWLQQRLQFIIFSLAEENKTVYVDADDYDDDTSDSDETGY